MVIAYQSITYRFDLSSFQKLAFCKLLVAEIFS